MKEGRRHAHCVWSRIDIDKMKAINLPHFKLKLRDISRQLYLEHGWQMPRGLVNSEERNPLNFTQAEWQQAKRAKQDPRAIKESFQDCWAISDTRIAFASALEERGYYLAKGDRRVFVALDWRGEVYAISRWVGIKAKEVKAKLGDPESLPSVEDTKLLLAEKFTDKLQRFIDVSIEAHEKASVALNNKRKALVNHHRQERSQLKQFQFKQRVAEVKARSARFPTGLKALWFRVTGKYRQIKKQNEAESVQCKLRDQSEMQKLIDRQLGERGRIQREVRQVRHQHTNETKRLNRDISEYLKLSPAQQTVALAKPSSREIEHKRKKSMSLDPG